MSEQHSKPVDMDILDKIIDLSKNNLQSMESAIQRLNTLENLLSQTRYTLHGNGEPGLSEKVRLIEKEIDQIKGYLEKCIKETKEEFEEFKIDFKKHKADVNETLINYSTKLVHFEAFRGGMIKWLWILIGTVTILGVKIMWEVISNVSVN